MMKRKCPITGHRCPDNEKCALWDWEIRDCAIRITADGILDLCDILDGMRLIPPGFAHVGKQPGEVE